MRRETEPMAWGFLAGAYFLIFALFAAQWGCALPRVENAPDAAMPTVAKLNLLDADGEMLGHCTAWKADHERLVTAGHCCEKGMLYTLSEGKSYPGSVAEVLLDDDAHDVCVLRGRLDGPVIPLAHADPGLGDYVWTAGYPVKWLLISDGYWSGRTVIEMDHDYDAGVISTVVRGGSSGSPVMNADGFAIGLLFAGMGGGDNIAFTTPLEWLRIALWRTR